MQREQQGNFPEEPKARPGLSKAKIIFFAVVFVCVLALIFGSKEWSQTLIVKEISINGNKYYPKQLIVDKVYTHILSHQLSAIDFEYVRKLILQEKFIKDVDFITTYPEKVIISITPKLLLAKGTTSSGRTYYLAEEGEMIEKGKVRLAYTLPELDYERIGAKKSKSNLKEIAIFLQNYYHSVEKKSKAVKIWRDKYGICYSLSSNTIVRVGSLNKIEEKFDKFETFINQALIKKEMLPSYIDLRWENQVVTN